MGSALVEVDVLVYDLLDFKSFVIRWKVDRGQVRPLREPRDMAHTFLFTWPLSLLVTFELVVTAELGVFFLLGRFVIIFCFGLFTLRAAVLVLAA